MAGWAEGGFSLVFLLSYLGTGKGSCVVETHRCDFPFTKDGQIHHRCQLDNRTLEQDVFFCHSQVDNRHFYGVCSDGCFSEDDTSIEFEADDPMAIFCKTSASECQFPFVWEGVRYSSCTSEGSEFQWCALQVDLVTKEVVGDRWGKCNMDTCPSGDREDTPPPDIPREARAVFSSGELAGVVLLTQQSRLAPLALDGLLEGVPEGQYSLQLRQFDCSGRPNDSTDISQDLVESLGNGSVTKISLEKWGVSLYNDTGDLVVSGGSLMLTSDCPSVGELAVKECPELACANIVQGEVSGGLDTTLIIVVTLVMIIIVMLLILAIIFFCCCKRREPDNKNDLCPMEDSIDDPWEGDGRSKSPLFDELSIPFIDASLPPTPKAGRTVNGLEILLGRRIGSSSSSLSDRD